VQVSIFHMEILGGEQFWKLDQMSHKLLLTTQLFRAAS
jgi:hypothetical protein